VKFVLGDGLLRALLRALKCFMLISAEILI